MLSKFQIEAIRFVLTDTCDKYYHTRRICIEKKLPPQTLEQDINSGLTNILKCLGQE